MIHGWVFAFRYVRYACVMYVTRMYRQNICHATYVLYSVIINTLRVGIQHVYMIELFSKAAITSIHVILLHILAVLGWPLGTSCTNGRNLNIA